jgi:hypothetical protein
MPAALRYGLVALLLLAVVGVAFGPAPRRRPTREWRWALRWLAVAALVWAGVAHALDADGVALGLLAACLVLACGEVWLLRLPREAPAPAPADATEPGAGPPSRPAAPAGPRRAPPLWRR